MTKKLFTTDLFTTDNQECRTRDNANGWIFGWTPKQAAIISRDTCSHDPKPQTPKFGIYGTLFAATRR